MRTALCVDMVSEAAYNIGFVKGGILSLPAPLHYAASIPKSGLEIKNRCTLEEESGQETLEGVNTDNVFIQWNGNDKRKRA